jgi:hypothetical protein
LKLAVPVEFDHVGCAAAQSPSTAATMSKPACLKARGEADTFREKIDLGGHLKTGHTWTLQNRPTERNQNKSIYTLREVVLANIFSKKRHNGFILA